MESKKENNGPFNGLLIDFGEFLGDIDNGYNFVGADNFIAENAISEVFGGFFGLPEANQQQQPSREEVPLATSFSQPPPSLNQPPPSLLTPLATSGFGNTAFGAKIESTPYAATGFGEAANVRSGFTAASPNPVQPKDFWATPKTPRNDTTSGFDDRNNNNKFPMESGVRGSGFGRSNDDIALMARRNNRSRVGGRGSSIRRRDRRGDYQPQSPRQQDPELPSQRQSPEAAVPKPTPLLEATFKQPVEQLLGGFAARTPTDFPTSPARETPKKRASCQKCGRCARYGHHADECYSTSHADTVRCYNCHDLGHLAARCPKPQRGPRRDRDRTRPSVSTISGGTSSTTDGGSQVTASDSTLDIGPPRGARRAMSDIMPTNTSVGLIVKLMQDPFLRREVLRTTPDAYDKMIKIMVEHVQLT